MNASKPKLLYVLQCYHNRGGVEEHTRSLAEGLSDDYHIRLVAPEDGKLVVVENGSVSNTLPADQFPWPCTPYRLPATEASLSEIVSEFAPDLIHVQHLYGWPIGTLDQLAATGIPLAISFHDYYAVTPYYTMQGAPTPEVALGKEWNQLIFQTDISAYVTKRFSVMQQSLAKCQAFIVPSSFLAGQLSRVLPFPYQVIPHGIVPFEPGPTLDDARTRFAFLGSKLPQKGWMELLKAFQILQPNYPRAELDFYGGGQKSPERASPGVRFLPAYTHDDLPKIMQQYAIGVIPSLFPETFSYVLSEHWHGGKPVAASNIGALRERITDGVNGRLFEPGNIDSMVETLSWFLESETWRGWSLPNARRLGEMLADYRTLYQSLLNRSS
ncbi:MAG: glycosyltransferase [Bdellovibrionota bacterium]